MADFFNLRDEALWHYVLIHLFAPPKESVDIKIAFQDGFSAGWQAREEQIIKDERPIYRCEKCCIRFQFAPETIKNNEKQNC